MTRAGFDTDGICSWGNTNPENSGHLIHCIWIECILTEKEIKWFYTKRMGLYFPFVLFLLLMSPLGTTSFLTALEPPGTRGLLSSAPAFPNPSLELLVLRTTENWWHHQFHRPLLSGNKSSHSISQPTHKAKPLSFLKPGVIPVP